MTGHTRSVVQKELERLLPGWRWVGEFLAARHAHRETLMVQLRHWFTCQQFFAQQQITGPPQLAREHASAFIHWRQEQGITRSTAVRQAKFCSFLMEEAVLRGYCGSNPLRNLRISIGPIPEKPEVTPALEQELRDAIERYDSKHKDFLRLSMDLGIYQGCRITETRLPLSNVDFDLNQIRLWVKGQKWRLAPLHPHIRSMLLQIKGQKWTFENPSTANKMSGVWRDFLERKGFKARYPKLCHHCFRVTCVSRLARAGVTESKAMKYVGHSSVMIHRIYQRLKLEDLSDCLEALKI